MSSHEPTQPEPSHTVSADPADRHERFLSLYTPAQRRIHAYIMTLAPASADADDILQETSIVLWRKFADYDAARPFVTWACGIARIESLRFLRERGRRMLPLDPATLDLIDAEHEALAEQHDERRAALDQCVAKLSETDRALVRACYEGEAKYKDVASELGRPVNSVYKSLGRIRTALAACIEQTIGKDGDQ